jgi:hypothetical protein
VLGNQAADGEGIEGLPNCLGVILRE